MCGYIHRGDEPPEWCPVCGASQDLFEPYTEEPQQKTAEQAKNWMCLNCSYIHSASSPPDICPVCGSPSDRFEALIETGTAEYASSAPSKVVIAGAGIAGVSAAEALRSVSSETEIVLLSKEHEIPYYRLNLTRLLANELPESELPIHPEQWYKDNDIRLEFGVEVSGISRDHQTVECLNGMKESYDTLILTIGSHPFIPPLPGATKEGVTTLRTIDNARKILEKVKPGINVVCIGGGILGLETAGALARRGAEVTMLEGYDYPMPRQLNRTAGSLLADYISRAGIRLSTLARAEEILGDERVRAVKLRDDRVLPADMVVIATGVRPNSYLARNAGIEVNRGIIVNDYLTTSQPTIFAAGDVAEHRGELYGTWSPSQYQGRIAGLNAAGQSVEFGGVPRSNILKVLGIDLFSIGMTKPEDASFEVYEKEVDGKYYGFIFRDTYLVGSILLGDASLTSYVKNAVESSLDFSGLLMKNPDVLDIIDYFAESGG